MAILVALAILGGVGAYFNGSISKLPGAVKVGMIFTALAIPLVVLFGLHQWLLVCDTRRMIALHGKPTEAASISSTERLIPRKESTEKAVRENIPGARETQDRHNRFLPANV